MYLASTDQSGVIKYFQPNMNNLTAWQGHREAIRGISFSPDDSRFATASDDSTIRIWSFEESREESVLTGGRSSNLTWHLAFQSLYLQVTDGTSNASNGILQRAF
jgi:WD40 repeat protein